MKKVLIAIVAVLIIIQFIPVNRENPESDPAHEIAIDMDVKQVLKRSCYDCHSNNTTWPAYSYVAPVSWLVANHVEDGRKHLNFSEWGSYTAKKQEKKREEIWEEVSEGEMPLSIYLVAHPGAELSVNDADAIKKWVKSVPDSAEFVPENEENDENTEM